MLKKMSLCLAVLILLWAAALPLAADPGLLLQQPTLSRTHIAFHLAGEIWSVPRGGGEARLLTSGPGLKSGPVFSPDGSLIAYSGDHEGNVDVYVIPATGGVPQRLTHHPALDEALGWTPDGKSVLFRSNRHSYAGFNRLFTVPLNGGLPTELPLPMGEEASYSADGTRLAYVPYNNKRRFHAIAWNNYRGGRASRIWLATLRDSSVEMLPRQDWNDGTPMWLGDTVYFLSDQAGPATLYAYDVKKKAVRPVKAAGTQEIKFAAAGPDAIVFARFGSLHIYDPAANRATAVEVRVPADLPNSRRHFVNARNDAGDNARLSPTGVRALFEARGEVLTVPAQKGDIRNLTETTGVAERDPAWSPDGRWVAYLSDESGEYQLHLRSPDGKGEVRKLALGEAPSFYYSPVWSPDSKRIAYTDKRMNLWWLDVASGKSVKVDTDTYDSPSKEMEPAWSPDSNWLAYTKQLRSKLRAIFAYSVESGQKHQLTDGMSDAWSPAWETSGKHLYFLASTDSGTTTGWLDMTSFNRTVSASAYLIVLRKDLESPLGPESDEEKVKEETAAAGQKDAAAKPEAKPDAKGKPEPVRIDMEDIDQRILALPLPARRYAGLAAGKDGQVFVAELPAVLAGPATATVHRFDLKSRRTDKLLENLRSFTVSADGNKMLYSRGQPQRQWFLGTVPAPSQPGSEAPPKVQEGPLRLDAMNVLVDPPAQWAQMYEEVWRIQRDFFYDPNLHGVDLAAYKKKYRTFLQSVGSRPDLNYLFAEMLGDISVGHLYLRMPSTPPGEVVRNGLLGADFSIENGRYRFRRVYHGENWNPELRAPLTQPGVNVRQGEYLLAVDGREVTGTDEVFRFFEGKANRQVTLKVGPSPDGKGAREVTVVPVESETGLRNRAWIDGNRRKVDEMSKGRVAYVYLPNTGAGGYTHFNRYFFAQLDREGVVVDERFNGGGLAADYVIEHLRRPLYNYWLTREGEDFTTPASAIFGPKAMIVNAQAGSGGDALPWYFRAAGLGPLIGTRTWGGLVGIYRYPDLMDGSGVTSPRVAFYNLKGQWEVENYGVAPDVEVEVMPADWRAGRDRQLETAVQHVLDELKRNPLPRHPRPPFPNFHQKRTADD
jgi:tricorn protease